MQATVSSYPAVADSGHSVNERSVGGVAAFPLMCGVLLWAACFFNTVDLNYDYSSGEDHVGLDWQVAVKLAIAGACGAFGLLGVLVSPRVRMILVLMPGCILVALGAVFILTSAFALPQAATVARVAALVNFGYLCFAPTALSLLGLRRLTIIILFALATNLVINWILYLVFPESGIYREELWGNVVAQRMGGLGHPNSVARTGVISIILALSMLRSRELAPRLPMGRTVLIALIAMGCMTMLATFSRTAIVAGAFAIGLLLLDRIFTKLGIFSTVSAVAVLIGLVVALELFSGGGFFSDSFLSMTTKTGDVEELTSATGRTDIWAEAIRLILVKPFTGYGLNSAPFLLQDFSLHPHNAVLHGLMSGGVLAGLLVFLLLVWNLFFGIVSPEPLVRAISIYVLVSGIFEDTVLDTFASPSTLLWLVALIHPAWHSLVQTQRQTPSDATISS